ncbi:MAG: ATP-binding protein [Muribaculaceae bacterium]|nr:ATP-binding protein [Muribaculaceae bacterium]
MSIVKKDDVRPERSTITVIYGMPGAGKTSLGITAEHPILIDTDRGYDRATHRVDTVVANCWEDITSEIDTIKLYKTTVLDTAKACLDDYLSEFVCKRDYKLRTNALKRYGAMADEFKAFVNTLRANGSDLIFICHDKETTEGDITKHAPDCTGQSKDLLIRIADQVGYVGIQNKQRVITFEPRDNYVGKDVAQLGSIVIPLAPSKEYDSCMSDIIKRVKRALNDKSEAQRKAQKQLEELRAKVGAVESIEGIESVLQDMKELPAVMKKPFFAELKESLATKGFVWDGAAKKFVKDETTDKGNSD